MNREEHEKAAIWTEKQKDRDNAQPKRERGADRKINRLRYGQTEILLDRETNREEHEKTGKETERQKDRKWRSEQIGTWRQGEIGRTVSSVFIIQATHFNL